MPVTTHQPACGNEALNPLPDDQRVFGWPQHMALWFSLGVGLLVVQIGAYLAPAVGPQQALIAIVLGSVIGSGLLAWVAHTGYRSGLSSAGLMHATYGRSFAHLPVLLNIVQLLGWTTFELVIMRDGTLSILTQTLGASFNGAPARVLVTLAWGGVLLALLNVSMLHMVRRIVSRVTLPLVIASLAWLSWQFLGQLQSTAAASLWQRTGDGSMGLFAALDLVIAMPVSWLPLVADYARHGTSGRGTLTGTWLGYTLANIWCYALGVLVVTVATPDAGMLAALLLTQGGLIALGLILVDELDNAYGDAYSGAVGTHSVLPHLRIRHWGVLLALVSTLLAVMLPMHNLEPFLLMLSSVFVPLYGVILGRLGLAPDIRLPQHAINRSAALLWLLGIATYHALAHWAPGAGSALPTLLLTFILAYATRTTGPCRHTTSATPPS